MRSSPGPSAHPTCVPAPAWHRWVGPRIAKSFVGVPQSICQRIGFSQFYTFSNCTGRKAGCVCKPGDRVGVSPSGPLSRSGGSRVHPADGRGSSSAAGLPFPGGPCPASLLTCGLLFCLFSLPLARTQHGDLRGPGEEAGGVPANQAVCR